MEKAEVEKFDAIIVDPDAHCRMRLKQACASVSQFGRVVQVSSIPEALSRLNDQVYFHVVFISDRFDDNALTTFIKEGKGTSGGQDSAYIQLLKADEQENTATAKAMMIGADGVLFEPYSVDILVEITVLASKIRLERSHIRQEAALRLLVQDIIPLVDVLAYSKSCKYEPRAALKQLRDIWEVLANLDDDGREVYFRLLVDSMEHAQIQVKYLQLPKYEGSSVRVRQKIADKLVAEFDKSNAAHEGE